MAEREAAVERVANEVAQEGASVRGVEAVERREPIPREPEVEWSGAARAQHLAGQRGVTKPEAEPSED